MEAAILAELARERAGEADDSSLAGDVVSEAHQIESKRVGGLVDDPPPVITATFPIWLFAILPLHVIV